MNTLHLIMQELTSRRSILDAAISTGGLYCLCLTLVSLGTWKIVAGMMRLEGAGWLFHNVSHGSSK